MQNISLLECWNFNLLIISLIQIQNVFGLFGVDILVKSADGKILVDDLLNKLNNGTIIVQNKNTSLENTEIQVQQETSPISQ